MLVVITAAVLPAFTLAAENAPGAKPAFPGYFHDGQVRIVSSSHQDTAWMDTPAACRRYRIDHVLLHALKLMREDPHYSFCMEGALHVMELLEAHPELRDGDICVYCYHVLS
jgi:alpha-mannosidase